MIRAFAVATRASALVLGALSLASCSADTDGLGGATGRDAGLRRDAGDAGIECCPIQLDFSCYQLGGANIGGSCDRICECRPGTSGTELDPYGCPVAIPNGEFECGGVRDSGPPDTGFWDAGTRDGGPRDGGPRDGGVRDGGRPVTCGNGVCEPGETFVNCPDDC